MKVEYSSRTHGVLFRHLRRGDCFKMVQGSRVYIKMYPQNGFNSVVLETGTQVMQSEDVRVTPLPNAVVVVND